MPVLWSRLPIACMLLGALSLPAQAQQEREMPTGEVPAPIETARFGVTLRVGIVASSPRGTFPSVIIDPSTRPTGSIGQEFGELGVGAAFTLSVLVPFADDLSWTLGGGTDVMVARFREAPERQQATLTVQVLKGMTGVEWSLLHFPESYRRGGLRSFFLAGGLDLAFSVAANRFEGPFYSEDTLAPPTQATGSFASGEPFRVLVGLFGSMGLRFALTPEIEILAEAGYIHALNPLFSGEAILDNDFTVDRMAVNVGIGWRFCGEDGGTGLNGRYRRYLKVAPPLPIGSGGALSSALTALVTSQERPRSEPYGCSSGPQGCRC